MSLAINFDLKHSNKIFIWLCLCIIFVILMIGVGGLTRLTRSGLSITQWKIITGIIPPINDAQWLEEFDRYKQIPEFKIYNQKMNLQEFKQIYFMEYFHRLLARITAMVFFIPLIWFYFARIINLKYFIKIGAIFSLVFVQGLIGWLMVKSGLYERTSVNEFWLAFHLMCALLIFCLISWQILILDIDKPIEYKLKSNIVLGLVTFFILPIQMFLGALVAGMHIIGFCYQNKDPLCAHNPLAIIGFSSYFDMPYLYLHRFGAVILFILIVALIWKNIKYKISWLLLFSLLIQLILGLLSVLLNVDSYLFGSIFTLNIVFAAVHQLNAFLIMFILLKLLKNNLLKMQNKLN